LRLLAQADNQRSNSWSSTLEIVNCNPNIGRVAQIVERIHYMDEVGGAIPSPAHQLVSIFRGGTAHELAPL
jgi:hypothetical protein